MTISSGQTCSRCPSLASWWLPDLDSAYCHHHYVALPDFAKASCKPIEGNEPQPTVPVPDISLPDDSIVDEMVSTMISEIEGILMVSARAIRADDMSILSGCTDLLRFSAGNPNNPYTNGLTDPDEYEPTESDYADTMDERDEPDEF